MYSGQNQTAATSSQQAFIQKVEPYVKNVPPANPRIHMNRIPNYRIISTIISPTLLKDIAKEAGGLQTGRVSFTYRKDGDFRGYALYEGMVYNPGPNGPRFTPDWGITLLLRFCSADASQKQDDAFPANFAVFVNDERIVRTPQVERITEEKMDLDAPRPLIITKHLFNWYPGYKGFTSLKIEVMWYPTAGDSHDYAMSIVTAWRIPINTLLEEIQSKKFIPIDYTKSHLQFIFANTPGLYKPESLITPLFCQLKMARMTSPCRSTACHHIQCFDAEAFLRYNEKMPTYKCPVCKKRVNLTELRIDHYFSEILGRYPKVNSQDLVELFPDGKFRILMKPHRTLEEEKAVNSSKEIQSKCSREIELVEHKNEGDENIAEDNDII